MYIHHIGRIVFVIMLGGRSDYATYNIDGKSLECLEMMHLNHMGDLVGEDSSKPIQQRFTHLLTFPATYHCSFRLPPVLFSQNTEFSY